jgi:hypothetical protein
MFSPRLLSDGYLIGLFSLHCHFVSPHLHLVHPCMHILDGFVFTSVQNMLSSNCSTFVSTPNQLHSLLLVVIKLHSFWKHPKSAPFLTIIHSSHLISYHFIFSFFFISFYFTWSTKLKLTWDQSIEYNLNGCIAHPAAGALNKYRTIVGRNEINIH